MEILKVYLQVKFNFHYLGFDFVVIFEHIKNYKFI